MKINNHNDSAAEFLFFACIVAMVMVVALAFSPEAGAYDSFTTQRFGNTTNTFGTYGGQNFNGSSFGSGGMRQHYGTWGNDTYTGSTITSGNMSTTTIYGPAGSSTCTSNRLGSSTFTNCY